MKRFGAYIIDFLIVILVTNIIGCFLPSNSKVNEIYDDSESLFEEYYEAIVNESSDLEKIMDKINDYTYELSKAAISSNLLTVIVYFLYFVVFQSYNNGQTLGKKILKIEVCSSDGSEVTFKQLFIRSIVIFPIAYTLIDIILILVLSKNIYLNITSYLTIFRYLIFIVCCFMVLFTGRGLHDRLAKTVVCDINQLDSDSKVSKWKENAEKEKNIKQNYKNHTRGKVKGKKE